MTHMHAGARDQSLGTPWKWIRLIESVLGRQFDVDVCASAGNAKAPTYYDKSENGLRQRWTGLCWCNPEFCDIAPWIAKGLREVQKDALAVVYVVPANRTEQVWWRALRRYERLKLPLAVRAEPDERIAYIGGPSTPPFPSTFWAIGKHEIIHRLPLIEDVQSSIFDE